MVDAHINFEKCRHDLFRLLILCAVLNLVTVEYLQATSYNPKQFGVDISAYEQIYTAQVTFDRVDYIATEQSPKRLGDDNSFIFTLAYRYKLNVQHVWKGNPKTVEYQYQCRLSHMVNDKLWMSTYLWDKIKKHSRQEPAIKLVLVNPRDDSGSINDCAFHLMSYDDRFTTRVKLGEPDTSYFGEYVPITTEDLLLYIRRYEYGNQQSFNGNVEYAVLNAINALKLLAAQKELFDYLRAQRFMRCEINSLSLAVMSSIIENIPEFFSALYQRFNPLLSCPDVATRSQIFMALSAVADRQTLSDMIAHVLQDDSAVVKRSAAYSTYAASISYPEKEDMMMRMLSSDDPDKRMFAALMMKRTIYWSHVDKMRKLCKAEPAVWYYDDTEESDSVAHICQELLQKLSDYSRESIESRALLDEFYSG